MRLLWSITLAVAFASTVFGGSDANSPQASSPEAKEPAKDESASEKIPDVNTIVQKANIMAYYQGKDGRAKVRMRIIDKKGRKRIKEFVILRKDVKEGGDQKYFVHFVKPADERKTVFMVHKHTDPNKDDDRWLYLPALSLVKRIAAGDKRTSFVGSNFLYEDVSGRSLKEDTHELIKTTDKFFVVKNVPKQPDTVKFSYYNVSISRKNYMPMKMEYYDKKGKLYRVIESKEIKKIKDFPTVIKSVAMDLMTGRRTEMEFSAVKYDIGLKDDIFTERYLHRPPPEARR